MCVSAWRCVRVWVFAIRDTFTHVQKLTSTYIRTRMWPHAHTVTHTNFTSLQACTLSLLTRCLHQSTLPYISTPISPVFITTHPHHNTPPHPTTPHPRRVPLCWHPIIPMTRVGWGGSWAGWVDPAPSCIIQGWPPGGEVPHGVGGKPRGTRVVVAAV